VKARALALVLTASSCSVVACGGTQVATFGPTKVDIPVADTTKKPKAAHATAARQKPPGAGVAKESPFPSVTRAKLANGLGVSVVTSHTLPIVQIRVVVHAGSGYGPAPGVAEITAEMLKDGGTRALTSAELVRRVETLGANLSVSTDFDATVIGTAVTKDHLGEALALLSQVVREPRFDAAELKKLKDRETDEAEDVARSSGAWTATRIMFQELYPAKSPYATYGLVPSEIAKIDGAQIRDFHRRFYVPKATELVLAGDVDADAAKALADRDFGKWTGGDPPKVDFAAPRATPARRVVIAHRPKSVQSDVFVALVAPERKEADWAAIRVANQVLGGGVASRLFADVREQRSLAYRTSAQIYEMAHGPQPLVVYAGTQTPKTAQAVTGLLENLAKMTTSPPTSSETDTASRYLSDIFAIRMETIGSIADMVVMQDTLGLPDGYWDTYRKELRATNAGQADAAAKKLYPASGGLIVVAGDADVIGPELARFGEVTVVDPEKEFKTVRTLPPSQPETTKAPR
jgi:zinc protease